MDYWFPSAEGKDSKVVGRFVEMDHAYTTQEGKKIETKVIMLEHKAPGSNDVSTARMKEGVNADELKKRFPLAWEQFEKARGSTPIAEPVVTSADLGIKGTPIDTVDFLNKRDLVYLKGMGIMTLQQLSEISDTDCQNIGFGSKKWRKQAADFLARPA